MYNFREKHVEMDKPVAQKACMDGVIKFGLMFPFTHAQHVPCGANLIIHVKSGLLEDTHAGRVLLLHLVHHGVQDRERQAGLLEDARAGRVLLLHLVHHGVQDRERQRQASWRMHTLVGYFSFTETQRQETERQGEIETESKTNKEKSLTFCFS